MVADGKRIEKIGVLEYIFAKLNFFKNDIWRLDEKKIFNRVALVILFVISYFVRKKQVVKAASLTYYTMFALVPTVAFILGIARGFGMDDILKKLLEDRFSLQPEFANTFFRVIESYLSHAKGGYFVGAGIIVLLYSVMCVFTQIEDSFNDIWNIKERRKIVRRFSDYISLLLVIPILITLTSGISIHFRYYIDTCDDYIISPTLEMFFKLLPLIITWLAFTIVYLVMPNVKVRFSNAAVAGLVAGIGFQLFRHLYLYFQTTVTNYNAIYGSFAAIPLLMLFIKISWCIVLFGAQISYALQTGVKNSFYGRDVKHISNRYSYFVMLCLANIIFKRFLKGERPLNVLEIAIQYNIPLRLVKEMLYKLYDAGILNKVEYESKDEFDTYQPALDVNTLTVAKFYEMIDRNCFGMKQKKGCYFFEKFYDKKVNDKIFGIEKRSQFAEIWEFSDSIRLTFYEACSSKKIIDFNCTNEKN